jgi:hypothetical protein
MDLGMRRRQLLGMIVTVVGISGCTSEDGNSPTNTTTEAPSPTETSTETQTTTVPSSDPAQDIWIVLENNTSEDVVVNLQISREDVILTDKVTIRSDGRSEVNSKITETGRYRIEISVDNGIEEAYSWNVEDYDLRTGSNMIISINENDVRIMVEE